MKGFIELIKGITLCDKKVFKTYKNAGKAKHPASIVTWREVFYSNIPMRLADY
jgi:hypothetical protein